jgi:hypothetical protein
MTVLALSLALAAAPWTANAAPHRTASRAPVSVLATLQGWLSQLWAGKAALGPKGPVTPTTDNGCILDPNGRCKAGQ